MPPTDVRLNLSETLFRTNIQTLPKRLVHLVGNVELMVNLIRLDGLLQRIIIEIIAIPRIIAFDGETLFEGRDGFECRVYEGYGHAVYDLAPDLIERLVRFFLQ